MPSLKTSEKPQWNRGAQMASRLRWKASVQVGNQEETMADALFVLITVSFFIVMWLYVRGCDRL
jgi:hypothetical protein